MDTIEIKKRQTKGIEGVRVAFHIPAWMLKHVDDEAKAKGQTRAAVMAYLIFAGLKAHTGEFYQPSKNTIRERWEKRGREW